MKNKASLIVLILIIVAATYFYIVYRESAGETPIIIVQYSCNQGKTITASYYSGQTPPPRPGEPPTPTGYVKIDLSDGRMMTLNQTISADGTRYADIDESFVFWSKGDGALVLENGEEKSYTGCIALAPDPQGLLPQTYSNGTVGFSVRYPICYILNSDYSYAELGPGKKISGVKFTIDPKIASGTNLSTDSYISVEYIPQVKTCEADMFFQFAQYEKSDVTDNGVTYSSVASTIGAAAGNRYEETVWAFPDTNPCLTVRYFVHYGVIENYPPGAVTEFNRSALLSQFDAIRRSVRIAQ